jgi:hypothetical protein
VEPPWRALAAAEEAARSVDGQLRGVLQSLWPLLQRDSAQLSPSPWAELHGLARQLPGVAGQLLKGAAAVDSGLRAAEQTVRGPQPELEDWNLLMGWGQRTRQLLSGWEQLGCDAAALAGEAQARVRTAAWAAATAVGAGPQSAYVRLMSGCLDAPEGLDEWPLQCWFMPAVAQLLKAQLDGDTHTAQRLLRKARLEMHPDKPSGNADDFKVVKRAWELVKLSQRARPRRRPAALPVGSVG